MAYLWSNRFDEKTRTVTMDLTFFVREKGELYRRFTEVHVQKAHDAAHLEALLCANGFEVMGVFGDKTFAAPAPDAQRLHFIALKAKS